MNPDQPNPKQSLSEISHLFLSSVRDRQTGGATRPVRKPPSPTRESTIDLTPAEFAQVFDDGDTADRQSHRAPVSAVIATHLNGNSLDRVHEYAGHLCAAGRRVGLIECDSSEFRLTLFERNPNPTTPSDGQEVTLPAFDARKMAEALEELSCDVDRWLVLLPSPRSHEARTLLREIDHWVFLSTCDHDGVVACYRSFKGFAEQHRPRISLALLDAPSDAEGNKVFRKLANATHQFLNWPLGAEATVCRPQDVVEHVVLSCRGTHDKAQLATAPQWQIVSDFLTRCRAAASAEKETPMPVEMKLQNEPAPTELIADVIIPEAEAVREAASFRPVPAAAIISPATPAVEDDASDVIDLPAGHTSPQAIITAILRGNSQQLVECPVKPPMCPDASLAVGRDHRLTLLAVARQGLSDLRAIGRAYQWLMENRALIAMAVPQFAIDAHQLPRLQLLIDQADVTAEILQPMLQSSNVTVLAYRKLRWAGRTGLLLNAA